MVALRCYVKAVIAEQHPDADCIDSANFRKAEEELEAALRKLLYYHDPDDGR